MKASNYFVLATIVTVVAASAACKRKEEPAPAPATTQGSATAPATATATTTTGSGSAATQPPADPNADYISVFASHANPKPGDPVEVHFDRFKVTKATFDPKALEGGTATIEIDLTSLRSPSPKRDAHLNSDSYFDTAKFATATIDIANVKKKDDTHYTADATVKLHGAEKLYPVAFEVLETTADSVRIRGEQPLSRLDFKVGKDTSDPDEAVAGPVTVKLQLTLKKT